MTTCPLADQSKTTYHPNGMIESLDSYCPIVFTLKIGLPMGLLAAAVNGVVAKVLGSTNKVAACSAYVGGSLGYFFSFFDYAGHKMRGKEYHKSTMNILIRNSLLLGLHLPILGGVAKMQSLSISPKHKAWSLLLPFAICQAYESRELHK